MGAAAAACDAEKENAMLGSPTAESIDLRAERRHRVLKRAAIIKSRSVSEILCSVRNQHGAGAELEVPVDSGVPTDFLLYVPVDGVAYQCSLRWRRNERVGVQFSTVQSKPRSHYG